MDLSRWNLETSPFARRCDARFFYDSPAHEEALARMYFLIEGCRPLGLLTGASGSGKSLLLQILEREIRRSQRDVCRLDLAGRNAEELLDQLAAALPLWEVRNDSPAEPWRCLQAHLESLRLVSRQLVLLLDHCEGAAPDCAAAIERLVNLTHSADARLTIIAAASSIPESREWDRLCERCDLLIPLLPLKRRETSYLIFQALDKAGCECEVFSPTAVDAIHRLSGGLPAQVMRLCDLALIAGAASGRDTIDVELVEDVARELLPQ